MCAWEPSHCHLHYSTSCQTRWRTVLISLHRAALEHLAGIFGELILADQDCFGSEEGYEALLQLLPDAKVVGNLRSKWSADPSRSSVDKWSDLKTQIKKCEKGSAQRVRSPSNSLCRHDISPLLQVALTAAMEDIILQYTYPRLDAEVSKHRNHLLKAPFCVHPKTGRVCVPVDPAQIEDFDPEAVPTVGQLLDELNRFESDPESPGEHHSGTFTLNHPLPSRLILSSDWERTSLKPYVEMLDKHALRLMDQVRKGKREMGVCISNSDPCCLSDSSSRQI